ncbi:hypothetical protein [Bradyrhizobium embrapense]|uniref:hypothetical protein n=1 Tax=Bradyrhizobium embrapense TaxID=630921 RepID=UPI0007C4F93E|nr:hypothetical protein [Bradyrhizobium embrapense]
MQAPEQQAAVDARPARKGAVRPMTAADVPAVARLFMKIYRGSDRPADLDLQNYLKAITLEAPSYSEATGAYIYEQQDGRIPSAMLAVPMRFIACGTVVPGRLVCTLMTDKEAGGAAQLVLTLRPRRPDIQFSDTASPTTFNHWQAIGAKPIPAHNLEWTRSFRPLGALAGRLGDRFFRGRSLGLATFARPIDALLLRRFSEKNAVEHGGAKVTDMSVKAFLEQAPGFIAHYAVRPLWSEEELGWLVSLAAQNTTHGAFTIRAVEDRAGTLIGCFVYYAAPGRTAHVLNVLSHRGQEIVVLNAMFHYLESSGHVEARGRAHPALMAGLSLQRWLVFRHKAFAVVLTRLPDANDAVARGDIFVGGLASEDWSRLMSDFH